MDMSKFVENLPEPREIFTTCGIVYEKENFRAAVPIETWPQFYRKMVEAGKLPPGGVEAGVKFYFR